MVGTKFTELERKIPVSLPKISDNSRPLTAAPESKIINVYQDGTVTLDRQVMSLNELTSRLAASRAQYHDLVVVVRGDAKCHHQELMNVDDACSKAVITRIDLSGRMVGDAVSR